MARRRKKSKLTVAAEDLCEEAFAKGQASAPSGNDIFRSVEKVIEKRYPARMDYNIGPNAEINVFRLDPVLSGLTREKPHGV